MTAIYRPGPAACRCATASADAVALEPDRRQCAGGETRPDAGSRGARTAGASDYRHLIALPGPTAGFAVSQLSAHTGLRLSGRADLDSVGLLKHAIAGLPADAGEIHLQLASLEFIDEAAARELVMLAARPTRPRLVLHYPLMSCSGCSGCAGPRPGRGSPSARAALTAPEPGGLGASGKSELPASPELNPDRETLAACSRRGRL